MGHRLLNRAKMTTATSGTGTVTLSVAVTKFLSFAEAGALDGGRYSYVIEEGNDFEMGYGQYDTTGPTLSREVVIASKISGTAGTSKMSLGGAATVAIVPLDRNIYSRGSLLASGAGTDFN